MSIMLWVTSRFGLMFDKGQKQSSTLSCDSSYFFLNHISSVHLPISIKFFPWNDTLTIFPIQLHGRVWL